MTRSILSIIIPASLLLGSCIGLHTRKGNEYYEYIAYSEAISHYEKVYRKTSDPLVELKLADSYFRTSQVDSARSIYSNAVKRPGASVRTYFDYGKTLMATGKHRDAADYFKKYLNKYPIYFAKLKVLLFIYNTHLSGFFYSLFSVTLDNGKQ